ncbi:MAG: hypothetical protein ACREE6_18270, partial [Limisphaerales bacterium]
MRILPRLWLFTKRLRRLNRYLFYLTIIGTVSGQLCAKSLPALAVVAPVRSKNTAFDLKADAPGEIEFLGPESAVLFSREIADSFKGALERDYVSDPEKNFPAGFVNASPAGQPWYGTMWTRDAGTFMRELVFWGYYEHACQVAQCIMDLVGTNSDGFIGFPRFLDPQKGPQG